MKNIHILPRKNYKNCKIFQYDIKNGKFVRRYAAMTIPKNIFITSDEEIKKGDWVLYHEDKISQVLDINIDELKLDKSGVWRSLCKKIILTTDEDLIKDGVQDIPDEFLEWFVSNPTCEYVEVVKFEDGDCKIGSKEYIDYSYEIILQNVEPQQNYKLDTNKRKETTNKFNSNKKEAIPCAECLDSPTLDCGFHKEEPKDFLGRTSFDLLKQEAIEEEMDDYDKQETLEQAAEIFNPVIIRSTPFGTKFEWIPKKERQQFIKGAKWQQERSYTEDEVHLILGSYSAHKLSFTHKYTYDMWFEQFKKK